MRSEPPDVNKAKFGWKKTKLCCSQAREDYLDYVWVDTCCIDKASSAELQEAINSGHVERMLKMSLHFD